MMNGHEVGDPLGVTARTAWTSPNLTFLDIQVALYAHRFVQTFINPMLDITIYEI